MWKKDDPVQPETGRTTTTVTPRPDESRTDGAAASRSSSPASIGSSITIRGEVTGDEDLVIEGRVDGSIDLKEHAVTVGAQGQVKAGITGRIVTVEGSVEGDLQATDVVVLRSSAKVHGDIVAPRVVLEDGASFRGGVDMGDRGASSAPATKGSPPSAAAGDRGAPAKPASDATKAKAGVGADGASTASSSSDAGNKKSAGER